jgi:shikimate dehydrogenase
MRAAVLGSPVAHSLSPVLHRAAYAELGLDWTYDAVECTEAGLAALVARLGPEWAGLSLTMPLKAAVLPLLDEADRLVERAGAANTLVLREGRRLGANTDVPGLVAALATATTARPGTTVTVLGGGATARSTLVSLAEAGYERVDVVVRRPAAVADLVAVAGREGLVLSVRSWDEAPQALAAELVVSTVPAGASDGLADRLGDRPAASPLGVLMDVVYAPWPTRLAAAWAAAGGAVVGGLELLLQQAALQVRLMTGTTVGADRLVAVMRGPGEAALAARAPLAG